MTNRWMIRSFTAVAAVVTVGAGLFIGVGPATADTTVVGPGDKIRISGPDAAPWCTLGPVLSATRALTAGHCAPSGSVVMTADGTPLGIVTKSTFNDVRTPELVSRLGVNDYAVIDTSGGVAQTRTEVLVDGRLVPIAWDKVVTRDELERMSAEVKFADADDACKIGVTTGYTCGIIDTVDDDYPRDHLRGTHAGMLFDMQRGDSGGPVFLADGQHEAIRYIGLVSFTGKIQLLSAVFDDCGCRPDRPKTEQREADRASVSAVSESLWNRLWHKLFG